MDEYFVKSGVYGLAVGDALGVPVEFSLREELEENPVVDMRAFGTWLQPRGTWSDDTSLSLATMGSIVQNNGEIDYDSLMREFVKWRVQGLYTQNVGVEPFDVGTTTNGALMNYLDGFSPLECGLGQEWNNGNGALMRMLPLAFTDYGYDVIENVSGLTHSHIRSKIGCVLYVEIARQIMKGGENTFCDYVANASELIQDYYHGNRELKHYQRIFDSDYSEGVSGRSHVVNTLESAIYSIKYGEGFESSLLLAVNLGDDTDTVGAVCGSLAGLYYGFDDIPSDWVGNIHGHELLDELIADFVKVI